MGDGLAANLAANLSPTELTRVTRCPLEWGAIADKLPAAAVGVDLILASECIYDLELVPCLLRTLESVMRFGTPDVIAVVSFDRAVGRYAACKSLALCLSAPFYVFEPLSPAL